MAFGLPSSNLISANATPKSIRDTALKEFMQLLVLT